MGRERNLLEYHHTMIMIVIQISFVVFALRVDNKYFFLKMNYCHASCELRYCKSEYTCFGTVEHG